MGVAVFVPFSWWNGGQRAAERWTELMKNLDAREEIISHVGLTIEVLSGVRNPVLLVYGENTSTLPSCCGLRECIPSSTSSIIPGAGHFFPLTRPKMFVNIVESFMKETKGE